jgi:hypothetical protein
VRHAEARRAGIAAGVQQAAPEQQRKAALAAMLAVEKEGSTQQRPTTGFNNYNCTGAVLRAKAAAAAPRAQRLPTEQELAAKRAKLEQRHAEAQELADAAADILNRQSTTDDAKNPQRLAEQPHILAVQLQAASALGGSQAALLAAEAAAAKTGGTAAEIAAA